MLIRSGRFFFSLVLSSHSSSLNWLKWSWVIIVQFYPKGFHLADRDLPHDVRWSPKGLQEGFDFSLPDRSIFLFDFLVIRSRHKTSAIWESFKITRLRRSLCLCRFHPRFCIYFHLFTPGLIVNSRVTRRSQHAHHYGGVAIAYFMRRFQLSTGAQTTD